MEKIYIYTGPTISQNEVRKKLKAIVLPPIKHGDILDALAEKVNCIIIIDGYYDSIAACRHKEILQALEVGVRVLGCSSMGAMRAAELDSFGMEGSGQVYRMYKQGELEGDDEVAVKHASQDENFQNLTVALVNLRYNIQKMVEKDLIDTSTAEIIIRSAKNMYFGNRVLSNIFAQVKAQGVEQQIIDRCRSYFRESWYDIKRSDAVSLLEEVVCRLDKKASWPTFIPPRIYSTSFIYKWNLEHSKVKTKLGQIRESEVLAQLKLSRQEYREVKQKANEKAWLKDYAQRIAIGVSQEEIDRLRVRILLDEGSSINSEESWLRERFLEKRDFDEFLQTEVLVSKLVNLRKTEYINTRQLLLEYTELCKLSAMPAEIEAEWKHCFSKLKEQQDSCQKVEDLVAKIDDSKFSFKLSTEQEIPELSSWCEEKGFSSKKIVEILESLVLLRKMRQNFYIFPGIVSQKQVSVELKIRGIFNKALKELIDIYEKIEQSGISTCWHPQWKTFVQSDIKLALQWFCKKSTISPKIVRDYANWKGFDNFSDFLDIVHLNYIASTLSV